MAAHIYKKSNANVVGVTLSEEQIAYAQQRKIREKLDKVEYRFRITEMLMKNMIE